MEIHRNQTINFRQHAFPLSGAAVPFLLKTRYQSLNVGDLFEYVADKLWELTRVRTNPNDFTLVNVCSPFSGYSHGSSGPPPLAARPKGLPLILTFATTMRQWYSSDLELRPQDVRKHGIHSTQWGTGMSLDFVSISVSTTEAHTLGLVNLQSNQCQYLYNTIGALTKSLLMHQTKYLPGTGDYSEYHSKFNLRALHNRLGKMPIPRLFQDIPYPLWAFSSVLWERAPNMIPQRCITPEVALYYFMFVAQTVSPNNNVVGDVKASRLGLATGVRGKGVMDHLSDSIVNFVQMVKTAGDTQLEVNELLAPAVLQSYIINGKIEPYKSADYMRVMSDEAIKFASSLGGADVGALLLPPDNAARNIMYEDRNFANRLLNELNLDSL